MAGLAGVAPARQDKRSSLALEPIDKRQKIRTLLAQPEKSCLTGCFTGEDECTIQFFESYINWMVACRII